MIRLLQNKASLAISAIAGRKEGTQVASYLSLSNNASICEGKDMMKD